MQVLFVVLPCSAWSLVPVDVGEHINVFCKSCLVA
jgi:hypothetical protein